MTPTPQTAETQLVIPEELRPLDGRFGSESPTPARRSANRCSRNSTFTKRLLDLPSKVLPTAYGSALTC